MSYAVTAYDLRLGVVVYLDSGGGWTEAVNLAMALNDPDERGAALARAAQAEQADVVVGAYEIEIEAEGGSVRPVRYRERIRAYGPTVNSAFARVTAPGHFEDTDVGDG